MPDLESLGLDKSSVECHKDKEIETTHTTISGLLSFVKHMVKAQKIKQTFGRNNKKVKRNTDN